jgi:hypothetical protein
VPETDHFGCAQARVATPKPPSADALGSLFEQSYRRRRAKM